MSTELQYLRLQYFTPSKGIWNNGFHCLSAEDVFEMLSHIKAFESPDMYSIISNKLVLLEHFEFDASHKSKKGMKGKKEEAALMQRIHSDDTTDEWKADQATYSISFKDWQSNFETTFEDHYKKIDTYINNVKTKKLSSLEETIVGFVVENKLSPMIDYKKRYEGELEYIRTKQFWDFFLQKEKVDFILFVGLLNGVAHTTYIDHLSFKNSNKIIDLNDEELSLSKLNSNEITVYGRYKLF